MLIDSPALAKWLNNCFDEELAALHEACEIAQVALESVDENFYLRDSTVDEKVHDAEQAIAEALAFTREEE
jgi:hypothetical protein